MNSFDIVSLDLFATLVYIDRKNFNPFQAMKNAIIQSGEFENQVNIIDEIVQSYYVKVREEMRNYEKETEFRNEDVLMEVYKEKAISFSSNTNDAIANIMAFYFDSAMPLIHLFPYVHETLNFLKEKGYTLILTSNHSYPPNGWAVLQKYDLIQYFHRIVFSGEIGWKKPSKKFFNHAFKGLTYSNKNRIIHIGDDPEADIRGALEFGIQALWVLSPRKEREFDVPIGIYGKIGEIKDLSQLL